jgi:hypothetical protein
MGGAAKTVIESNGRNRAPALRRRSERTRAFLEASPQYESSYRLILRRKQVM